MTLEELCAEATQWTCDHNKRSIVNQCEKASGHLMTIARREHVKLRKARGFFHGAQHWWCITPDDVILDPTGAQFRWSGGINGVVCPGDENHSFYEEVTDDYPLYGYSSRDMYRVFRTMKWERGHGIFPTRRGEAVVEERVDKKGRSYTFHGFEVYFSQTGSQQVRSCLVFSNSTGSVTYAALMQSRRIVKEKVYYPTTPLRLVQLPNGCWVKRSKGRLVKASIEEVPYELKQIARQGEV